MRPDTTRSAPALFVFLLCVLWGAPQKPCSQDGGDKDPPPAKRCIADTLSHRRAGFLFQLVFTFDPDGAITAEAAPAPLLLYFGSVFNRSKTQRDSE